MKVFISWSGTKSHKVALVFRDWFPSVIQSVEPYVSSEDIDKGARWSTDIAKELENSTFGVLCVTKENISEPWLAFEAGALSKTMDKSLVSPFLFNLKRSEVKGPILQFQSTIFEKDDIKKLISTLNKACGDSGIAESRLDETFDVWYPNLEKKLNEIKDMKDVSDEDDNIKIEPHSAEILEEILELSRNNQKLLRNPDFLYEEIGKIIEKRLVIHGRESEHELRRMSKRFHPMFFDEFMHFNGSTTNNHFGFLVALSFFKTDFPWIYDLGKELTTILKSKVAKNKKVEAIEEFNAMVEFSFRHPLMKEMYGNRKDFYYMKEMPHFLLKHLNRMLDLEETK